MTAIVIVTGAADGIGWATAQRLAQDGLCVALLDLNGEAAQARAEALGGAHFALSCDVTSEQSVEAAIAAVEAELADPAVYLDYTLVQEKQQQLDEKRAALEAAFAEWEQLMA